MAEGSTTTRAVREWVARHHLPLLVIAAVLVLALAGYMLWQRHTPQPVTGESQQQAETPQGVEQAAKNAHIQMLQSQLDEAAKQIAALKNRPPEKVVQTVPVEVAKTVEVERQKSGADFAIVTEPSQPNKPVNLKQVQQLPANTQVTLNQYNIKAYPHNLIEATVYPSVSGVAAVDVAYMHRVRVFGATGYVGPAVSYDQDRTGGKVRVGARVTITR